MFFKQFLNSHSIMLAKKKIVTNDQEIRNIMNNYFSSIVCNLKSNQINNSEKLNNIIKTFENDQSVQKIKVANPDETKTLDFLHVTEEEIENEMYLSPKKSTSRFDIPTKVLKDSINVYSRRLTTRINSCLE